MLDISTIQTIFAVIVLLILSAFFSSAETALLSSSRPFLHQLAKRGVDRAKTLLAMLDQQTRIIATLLLSNNIVNVVATSIATALCIHLFGAENGVAIASISMTLLIIVFAEIIPKSLAAMSPHKWALFITPVVHLLSQVLSPLSFFFGKLNHLVAAPFGLDQRDSLQKDAENEEELLGVIDLHGQKPENRDEQVMLRSILELEEISVTDVMTHRSDVHMINFNQAIRDIISETVNSKYTRLLFYNDTPENITGVLHAKNLLSLLANNQKQPNKRDLIQLSNTPWFIPDTTNLKYQLLAFRKRREHVAVIIDEYGSFVGIVTLEDILEEIVGNIDDELDTPLPGVFARGDGSFVVDGRVTLRDLNRDLNWDIDDDKASTIAGYLLQRSRLIPEPKQVFSFNGFLFEVLERHHNRIAKIRITPPQKKVSPQQKENKSP